MSANPPNRFTRNPTAGYRRPQFGYAALLNWQANGEPWFTWNDIPLMVRDPAVRLGLRTLRGPFRKVSIARDESTQQLKITGKPAVRRFIAKTWKQFWTHSLPRLLHNYFKWGRAPGGVEWEYDRRKKELYLSGVRAIEPFDATPFVWDRGRKRNQFAGYQLRSHSGGAASTTFVGTPNAFWFCGFEELAPWCDEPRLMGAFTPWLEKNAPSGLRASRRLAAWTKSVPATLIRHPNKKVPVPGVGMVDSELLAVQFGISAQNGSIVVMSSEKQSDKSGDFAWTMEKLDNGAGEGFDIAGLCKDADEEIWFGLGLFPEIIRAQDVGSGYSGRAIPMETWLGSCDELAGMVDGTFRAQVLHPGVRGNFGRQDWDYEITSLLKEYLDQQMSGAGPNDKGRKAGGPDGAEPGAPPTGPGAGPRPVPVGGSSPPGGGAAGGTGGHPLNAMGDAVLAAFGAKPRGGVNLSGAFVQTRGQPGNPGEFGPGGYGGKKPNATGRADPAVSRSPRVRKALQAIAMNAQAIAGKMAMGLQAVGMTPADLSGTIGDWERIYVTQHTDPLQHALGCDALTAAHLLTHAIAHAWKHVKPHLQRQSVRLSGVGAEPDPAETDPDRRTKWVRLAAALAMIEHRLAEVEGGKDDPEGMAHRDAIAELADDPEEVADALSGVNLSWIDYGTSRSGKKRWKDSASGKLRYQNTAPGTATAERQRRQADAGRGHEITRSVARHDATPADLRELSDHLPAMTVSQLRTARQLLQARFGSAKARDGMVKALQEHVAGRAAAIEGAKAKEPPAETGPKKRDDGTPEEPKKEHVYTVDPSSIHVDPKRFQYKVSGIGDEGVTDELKGVKEYKPELGGTWLVWRDPSTGKDYVVNAHHRRELALRSGAKNVNVRYIDAGSAKEARAVGALANIAEGRGTAIDAAKYMRDTGSSVEDLKDAGVSLSGRVAADGVSLTKLNDKAFDRVLSGKLDEARAVAVARHLDDPAKQEVLFKMLDARDEDGKDWSTREIERAAQKMARSGSVTKTGTDLFGSFEEEHPTFAQEVELESYVGRQLAQTVNDYAAVGSASRADRVKDAGNVLSVQENQKRKAAAIAEAETFATQQDRKGVVADAIKAGAADFAKATTKKEKDYARSETLKRVRAAIEQFAADPFGTRADAGGAQEGERGSPPVDRSAGDGAKPEEGDVKGKILDHLAANPGTPIGDLRAAFGGGVPLDVHDPLSHPVHAALKDLRDEGAVHAHEGERGEPYFSAAPPSVQTPDEPAPAAPVSVQPPDAVPKPVGNEGSRGWWNGMTEEQRKAALAGTDPDRYSAARRKMIPDLHGWKYDKDFRAQSVIDDAFARARDASPPAAPAAEAPAAAPAPEPAAAEEPRPSSWLGPNRQLDLLGGSSRAARPSPPAVKQSLITRDMEKADDVSRMEDALNHFKEAANPDGEPPLPEPPDPGPPQTPEPPPDATPRQAAAVRSKVTDPDFAFARSSAVPNAGEDLAGSARHNRNRWKGLADAEKDGTAAELVTRDNLLRNEPHDLIDAVEPTRSLPALAAHLALSAFPAEPFDAEELRRYKGAMKEKATPDAELREQYYRAYQTIKDEVQRAAREESDPWQVLDRVVGSARELQREYRKAEPGSDMTSQRIAPDRYNPVANGLANLIEKSIKPTWGKPKANSAVSRLADFALRVKDAYPDLDFAGVQAKVADHVKDVIEGDSFNKTFGTVAGGKKRFDPSEAYVTDKSVRKGGPDVNAQGVQQGTDYIINQLKMRGLQWGNYVTDAEREHHLEHASGAITDLADVTGLPVDAMSWGGRLGLAIGARGKGGALAHYEPDQAAINLTRNKGVGSLAHEWGHFLDHMLTDGAFDESKGERKPRMLSEERRGGVWNPDKKTFDPEPVADPVRKAMRGVVDAFKDSGFDYRLNSHLIDLQKTGLMDKKKADYWKSRAEKFARSFERHVQRKLHGADRENTYLVALRKEGHPLWPTDEEADKMAPAFDALLKAAAARYGEKPT